MLPEEQEAHWSKRRTCWFPCEMAPGWHCESTGQRARDRFLHCSPPLALQPIAYRFRKGNRVRLENANGDSPVTDGVFFHFYRPDKIGADTIYHDAEHPSELVLPTLDVD